jgi:hypothetical protein
MSFHSAKSQLMPINRKAQPLVHCVPCSRHLPEDTGTKVLSESMTLFRRLKGGENSVGVGGSEQEIRFDLLNRIVLGRFSATPRIVGLVRQAPFFASQPTKGRKPKRCLSLYP